MTDQVAERKILVVDDEAPIRDSFELVFKHAGYAVKTAVSAEETMEVLTNESIAVMFVDLKLPKMNGIDLCREIRQKYPRAVIYAMTGYSTLFEVAECYEAGFDDYFEKPVKMELLLMAADAAFNRLQKSNPERTLTL